MEVGANTTIDRGSTHDTVIGAGTRIDNLVQIGHNVRLGRCCVIVAQVGIAGSTILEDFVQVGGQAAMAGHLRIGQGSQIGAQSGSHFRRPRRFGVAGKPGAAAERVLPPGRHTEANDAAAQVAAIPELCCHIVIRSAMMSAMVDISYRVVPRSKRRFDVEMAKPDGHRKMIEGFGSEHEASAWIVQTQRMIRAAGPWTPLAPRKPNGASDISYRRHRPSRSRVAARSGPAHGDPTRPCQAAA